MSFMLGLIIKVHLTFRLEQAVEEESRGESNLQPEGPNYNLSGKLTEYSNTYKVTSLAVMEHMHMTSWQPY